MNIIRHIKVDLYGDVKRYAVAAKQLDMATRYVGVTLTVDGVEWEIPKDVEIAVAMRKPDEKRVWNDCTRQKNEALIPLTRQMLAVQGTALCDVELYQNGALLSSASFELEIYPSQRVDETIISSEEYTRLENAIYAAREALQMAQETSERINAAEALREAAEAVINSIMALESELTKVQRAKTKAIESLSKIRLERGRLKIEDAKERREADLHELQKEMLDAQIEHMDASTNKLLGADVELEDTSDTDAMIYGDGSAGGAANEE